MIPSPCTGLCTMDADERWCLGCRRTLAEIAEWGTASDERRKVILAAIEKRPEP